MLHEDVVGVVGRHGKDTVREKRERYMIVSVCDMMGVGCIVKIFA